VLIATDSDFADALSAGAVQGLLEAPLLLTPSETLTPETAAEIRRVGANNAVIFGGTDAVSATVETELQAMGLTTERVEGPTRIETAVAVQQRFFPSATAVVLARAFGTDSDMTQGFADSVSAGAYATVSNTPVLLTETDVLSDATATAISASTIDTVTIVGGTAAVEESVAQSVASLSTRGTTEEFPGVIVRRLAGINRFDTTVKINNDLGYTSAADSPRVILVEGQANDAWTGSLPAAVQAGNGASIVLANGDLLLSPTFDFLFGASVPLICGPNVTETACDKAFAALQGEGEADMPPSTTPGGGGSEEPTEEPTEEGPTGTPLDDIIDEIPTGAPTPGPTG
jgi:putative cell wall-binding protein